jgi:hypothetical protein
MRIKTFPSFCHTSLASSTLLFILRAAWGLGFPAFCPNVLAISLHSACDCIDICYFQLFSNICFMFMILHSGFCDCSEKNPFISILPSCFCVIAHLVIRTEKIGTVLRSLYSLARFAFGNMRSFINCTLTRFYLFVLQLFFQ